MTQSGGLASDRLLRMTGSLVIARRSVIVTGFLGAFVFLIPVVLDSRSENRGDRPLAGFLFRRVDRSANLVDSHGYRAALRRFRQRHDELRIRSGWTGLAFQFRLSGGSNGQLGSPVYRVHCAVAPGSGAGNASAARAAVRSALERLKVNRSVIACLQFSAYEQEARFIWPNDLHPRNGVLFLLF